MNTGFIGFGEAAFNIALGLLGEGVKGIRAYDAMENDPVMGKLVHKRAEEAQVEVVSSPHEIAQWANLIIAAVPSSYTVDVCKTIMGDLNEQKIYADVSASTPSAKITIWNLIKDSGVKFVDAAMLGSLPKDKHKVPITASGNGAKVFQELMTPYGMKITLAGDKAGAASAIKLVRSIYMKGIAALMIEMLEAANAYGVEDEVIASIGFANPNVLGVAQMIAEVPVFSGTGPRAVCCILNIIFMYLVTWNYYKKIKKDPTKSLNYGSGMLLSSENDTLGKTSDKITQNFLTQRQTIVVGTFLIGVIICVGMTIKFGWKANKIGSYFLGMGVVAGILSGFSMNDIAKKFIKGCGPMVTASFVVGIASAVSVILNNGKILDTLVNWVSIPLAQLGPVLGAGFMVVVNALINILIPSGSGQAAVVMPLMTPMADIIGITRQVTVQAFQFGDGLSNLITPLNGTLMGGLAMAHVEFPRYFKWVINIIAGQVFVAAIVTMLLQYVGWTGL